MAVTVRSAGSAKGKSSVSQQAPGLSLNLGPVKDYDQRAVPLREWDRATQFMSAFAVSGFLSEQTPQGDVIPVRPASVLLVGGPGSGKTEIVERFRRCHWISYHNDMTVRSLLPLLRKAEERTLTHVAAPEFNKWFQRKAVIAENCVGLLSSAMEEGVDNYDVGGEHRKFNYARLGLFAGMTPGTMTKRKGMLGEMGFLTRAAVLEWALPREERDEILHRMNTGLTADIEPIALAVPPGTSRATVQWEPRIGLALMEFVRRHWSANDLRTFKRFKVLLLARAYLTGAARVRDEDWQWLRSYDDYWNRLIVSED